MKHYDAIVLGAGPAGSVTALAFARRGARVALLEADPRSSRRFAGEWLHPAGVAILEQLGLGAPVDRGFRSCRGFVVVPDDAGPPIELPYQAGRYGWISEHRCFVGALRAQAVSSPGVDYYDQTRAVAIDPGRRTVTARCGDRRLALSAERIVGADGHRSWLRRELGLTQDHTSASQQAAIELLDIELPFEGFGHVVLGGPSYMLLYRLTGGSIRAVFDLPRRAGWPCTPKALWEAFGPVVPPALRAAVRSALARGEVSWAAARHAPHRILASGPIMFVGDAAGVVHPLTAAGMTLAFADATVCAAARSAEEYARARARDSRVPALLADLLYDVFTGREPPTAALRAAVFRSWRTQPAIRDGTIDLLALAETRATRFSRLFLEIAGRELPASMAELIAEERYRFIPSAVHELARWARSPVAAMTWRHRAPVERARPHPAPAPIGSASHRPRDPGGHVMTADAGEPPSGGATAGTSVASDPIDLALDHLVRHQRPQGGWSGRNNSMMFCLPFYVGAAYVARSPIDDGTTQGMIRFLRAHQMPDGGWALHLEGQNSVMMTTALCYVAARMLGLPADDPAVCGGREWIRARGGPTGAGTLAKSFLAALGLFDYAGVDPVPPELWLLPAPVHPRRLYGHMRQNYVALAYLHGRRLVAPPDPLLGALREELYPVPYERVDWRAARGHVASSDALVPRSRWIRAIDAVCATYERHPIRHLREHALRSVFEVLCAEDANTDYECFSLITKALHMLVWGIAKPGGPEVRRHADRLSMYLEREDRDGIDARTCSSSVQWDTALAVQAIVATGRAPERRGALENAHSFLASRQIQTEPVSVHGYRSRALGGWSFSESNRHWPVTDCTAEALRACLQIAPLIEHPLPTARLRDAVGYILHHQNKDGGWPAYERARAPGWISRLNRSDVFGKVMCDFSHVECTGSCMRALAEYRERFPAERPRVIADALARGEAFLRRAQRADGSFLGYWGVCFTYAAWFAVEGLRAVGVAPDDEAIRRASLFLQSWQRADGSWGESVEGNRLHRYVPSKEGHPVMTAWAVLALVAAGGKGSAAVRRGAAFLARTQEADGGWRSPSISGAFMHMHAMAYGSHVRIFPMWALAAADEGGAPS